MTDGFLDNNEMVEMSSAKVCRILKQRIQSGRLKPGERLVRRTIANDLNVSPIPVIEALYKLEKEGLVEHVPMQGARVKRLTMEQVRNDLVLREAIESQCARLLAAAKPSRSRINQLCAKADELDKMMSRHEPSFQPGMKAHAEFHLALAQQTGFPILVEELRKVWSRRFMQLAWIDSALVPVARDWHRRLIKAIASHDIQKADEAARLHVCRNPAEHETVMHGLEKIVAKLQADIG